MNALLARVNENSRKSAEDNEIQTAARMSIGIALGNSLKEGKEDLDKLILANSKVVAQQNETNTQLSNLAQQQKMSETSMSTFRDQMSILATSITNIGGKQEDDSKGIMNMMQMFTTQLSDMSTQFTEFKTELAHIKNNNSLPPNLFPYPQLMPPHLQPTAMMMRAHYEQGQGIPPHPSTLGNKNTPSNLIEVSQPRLDGTPSTPKNTEPTLPDQAFTSPIKTPENPSVNSKEMDTEDKNRKRTGGSPNTPPDNKKINSNPHMVQDKIKKNLEFQRQEEELLLAQSQIDEAPDPPGTQPVEGSLL